jgi:uncharacterized membrane protein YhaH (DUF805 family)
MTTPNPQNPYVAPRAAVEDSRQQYQPVRVFAVSGRIGRARYIAYGLGLQFLILALAAVLGGFLGDAAGVAIAAGWIAVVVLWIMLTIQRAHDFNASGWLAILGLVPLVNLIFWFIPGTEGPNRFGAMTAPNSAGVLIAAWIVPALFLSGIVAAVSIPAYQEYVKRAQQK